MNKNSKKLIYYLIILVLLILIIVCNNLFWKIGKESDVSKTEMNNINVSNVIYDVPYEEIWLEY